MDYRIIKGIITALIGVLLISINAEGMMSVIMLLIGIATVAVNLMRLLAVKDHRGEGKEIMTVTSAIGIVLGVLLAVMRNSVLTILIGVYMIVLPIVDVIMSKYKTEQLKAGLPKILFGVVLVAIGPGKALEIISDIGGLLLVVFGAIWVLKAVFDRKIR